MAQDYVSLRDPGLFRRSPESYLAALEEKLSKVRLRIVAGHKAFMGELGSLPTRYLLEVHLTHALHHAKMRLNEIFPALTTVNILLAALLVLALICAWLSTGAFRAYQRSV